MRDIVVEHLGLIDYLKALAYQEHIFDSIIQSKLHTGHFQGDSHLMCLEHPSVYTIGKHGDINHLLKDNELPLLGKIPIIRNKRGGDITYHGPGQLVVYPILDLEQFFTDLKKYMWSLEEVVIRVLGDYGIQGERSPGEIGVWLDVDKPTQVRKICAMGVRCSRWVTMHGIALNVNTNLDYFKHIVPCGIYDKGVTSIAQELQKQVPMEEVTKKFIFHFVDVFKVHTVKEK